MTWLENQFPEEPDPTPDPLTMIQVLEPFMQAADQFGKFSQHIYATMEKFSKPLEAAVNDKPKSNSKYRENSPRYSPPQHVYDRRGRKRY